MEKVVIANRPVGEGEPVFIIAEIGSNHDGKLEQARQLISQAKECGADAVKFQSFTAAKLVSPKYEKVYQAVQKVELPLEWHSELAAYSASQGIIFMSTPFDEGSASLLNKLGVPAFKIASYDVTNHPLLRHVAGFKKPLILSTGMATLSEVEEAVKAIRSTGNNDIILLHCISNYPPRPEDINLKAIVTMQKTFQLPVGFSDHSPGILASLGAVALGACVIEKHITIDKTLPGPDHPHALEVDEFREMVRQIRNLELALGDGVKAPVEAEMPEREWRRGIYAATSIPKGTKITLEMLKIVRPCIDAFEPTDIDSVVGSVAKKNIAANEPINGENV
jgi:N,N'-diacetyllegionaminate synthase